MARVAVRLSESALADLESIRNWYDEQGVPEIAERFLTDILEHIDQLRDHPDIGRIVPEFNQPELRELIHPPYRIVYRRVKFQLQIVRVWRSEGLLGLSTLATQ